MVNAIGGIRYGHEWIWHLVKLVNAGGGHWDGAASEMTRPGGWTEVWRFGAAAANHPSPSGDGEGTLWEWRRRGDCYRVKKNNYFL